MSPVVTRQILQNWFKIQNLICQKLGQTWHDLPLQVIEMQKLVQKNMWIDTLPLRGFIFAVVLCRCAKTEVFLALNLALTSAVNEVPGGRSIGPAAQLIAWPGLKTRIGDWKHAWLL